PDTNVPETKLVLPPLPGKPQKERYSVLKPIAPL
ncbi:MAG TPA: polyphosphate kinase 2, partial [Lysobacter sp.]|nr:polyphosphate kinase 2 [Lysobacter sp.]